MRRGLGLGALDTTKHSTRIEQTPDAEEGTLISNFYADGPNEIIPRVFLGNEMHVKPEVLERFGIKRILNVAKESNADALPVDLEYMKLSWAHNENINAQLEVAFEFIDRGLDQNQNVLVHCQLGISRSASLVIAYIMYKQQISFAAAYAQVKAKNEFISPNIHLISQLVEFEQLNRLA